MSKRRRLKLTPMGTVAGVTDTEALTPQSRAPIAQVAGEAAALSALGALEDEWGAARAEGRLVVALPLTVIEVDHLIRDRVVVEDEALDSLKQSLRSRGQQTPIEVTELAEGRFGLISGWRRLTALRQLAAETGDPQFDTVQALLRRPDDLAQSYVAMVEENEIRADLSFFERARIVIKAVEAGVFESEKQALQSLFSSASYAKRSKVKSFIAVVTALDGVLRFPTRLTERQGLAVAKVLETPGSAEALISGLRAADPQSPEAEQARLAALLRPKSECKQGVSESKSTSGDITLTGGEGRVVLEGADVTSEFVAKLRAWLLTQGK